MILLITDEIRLTIREISMAIAHTQGHVTRIVTRTALEDIMMTEIEIPIAFEDMMKSEIETTIQT